DFRIGSRAKNVAALDEIGFDLHEVEDLAVERDDDRFVFVVKRLLAALEVDDRQASMTETDARLEMKSIAIGAAVAQPRVHCAQQPLLDRAFSFQIDDAGNTAHQATSPSL